MSTEVATVDRELEECAYDIELAQASAVWQVIAIGKALTRARELIRAEGTRCFAEWCQTRVKISKSGAYRSIQVYERFGERPSLGRLEVSAAYALAMDGVPEEAIEAAVEEAQTRRVSETRAKGIVSEHRMEVVRDEPPEAGSADYDRGIEPDVEDEPVAVKAKAKPPEQNDLGDFGLEIDAHVNEIIDLLYGKPEFWRVFARERLSAGIDRI